MPHTDTRRVREDYWYTSAQIADIGLSWAQENSARVFLYASGEVPNRSAFEKEHVPGLTTLPKKILLPVNKGMAHWTAITIDVSQSADQKIHVSISYTDSMNGKNEFKSHGPYIKQEIARIEGLFRAKYGSRNLIMNSSVYAHTWTQPDGSSCGPYSLANGMRCLERRGDEVNPGRQALREQQLNRMNQLTAIHGCSTNNLIDQILLDWILEQTSKNLSVELTTAAHVQAICTDYANKYKKEVTVIERIFHDEYCAITKKPWFRPGLVHARVLELIGDYGITVPKFTTCKPVEDFKKQKQVVGYEDDYSDLSLEELIVLFKAHEPVQQVAATLSAENIFKKIDNLRKQIAEVTHDELYALELMEQITTSIYKANLQEAENIIKNVLGNDKIQRERSCALLGEIFGLRKFSSENNEKLIYIANAYKSLADAMKLVKQVDEINLNAPRALLEAHVTLLQGAIERNNASIFRQVCFAINDFCSSLFEWLTGGRWQSDIIRIEVIASKLKDEKGKVGVEQFRKERSAIETILDARANLEKEINDDLNFHYDSELTIAN